MTQPAIFAAHADWSVSAAKRWMSLASRHDGAWHVAAPVPVGPTGTLLARLSAMAAGAPVALGVDFPLGLPRAYAATLAPLENFPAFLESLGESPAFFQPCTDLAELSVRRPFYPARSMAGVTRAAHAAALGFAAASDLSRWCDRATAERPAGAPLFWTLGANQTGKAAIAAWRDLVIPGRIAPARPGGPSRLRLWPFEGNLLELLVRQQIVIAETYPAESMRHLGVGFRGSKQRQSDRAAVAPALRKALAGMVASDALLQAIDEGFGPVFGQDDGFDSLLGVLGVIGVLEGRRPDGIPPDPWLRQWEGWVLGQTALPAQPAPTSGAVHKNSRTCCRIGVDFAEPG